MTRVYYYQTRIKGLTAYNLFYINKYFTILCIAKYTNYNM